MPRTRDEALATALGKRIKQLRNNAGYTQEALAEAVKMAPNTIARIEAGDMTPTLFSLARMAPVLGVSLSELVVFPPHPIAHPMDPIDQLILKLRNFPEPRRELAIRLCTSLVGELTQAIEDEFPAPSRETR